MNLRIVIYILLLSISVLKAELLILHQSTDIRAYEKNKDDAGKLVKVANKNNINIKLKGVPWKRGLVMIQKGLADGIVNASYKKDRAKYAMYPMKNGKIDNTKRLNDGNSYFIYKNKNTTLKWDGKRFSEVDGPVGAKDGYAVLEDLKKHKNIEIKIMGMEEHLISALLKGKISAYAANAAGIEDTLKRMPHIKDKLIKEPIPIRKKPYFVIFSKKMYENKKNEIEKLWNGLKEYNENK